MLYPYHFLDQVAALFFLLFCFLVFYFVLFRFCFWSFETEFLCVALAVLELTL